ncbi:M16 family metallopeptidase [Uliginosibacterium sp. TH139]|uniref:M16 family metallopeptidase n=1 Tax=Uliginosibacterium sp. TH139 TaxID=2067453 RepID=UPI000C79BFE7|nr:pitrilysin family protein [Uliginosibacterium sp. TH139]PLK47012.1 hypothetical protein C0V76_18985 [Uliginosibacterium sp. TH139]
MPFISRFCSAAWLRALFLLVACALPLLASAAPEPGAFLWDPRVVRGELANGFPYYIVPVKDGSAQVSMQLVVRVGSLDERDDQSGVAHMVEHMVFHASQKHPEGLRDYMTSLGWQVGRHYNAQTNFERTLYMLSPEKRPERMMAALDVLAEIAGGAKIPDAGLESERKIILEEWRTKLGLTERMERQRRALLRAGSLYPARPTIGSEASIRTQPASALRRFYADWYRPGNMALLIVGDVDPAEMELKIRARFSGLEPAELPARNPADPVLGTQLRIARVQDAESGTSQVGWVFRFKRDPEQNRAGFRNRLIDRLAERLVRHTVRQRAGALPSAVESLTSSRGELGGNVASLGFAASVALGGHQEGLRQILLAQEQLRREGVDRKALAEEIAEVHRLNDKSLEGHARRDISTWQQLLGEALVERRILQDPQQKQAEVKAIMASITAADVEARVREWLASPDQLLFMLAPGLSPLRLPSQAEVEALRARIASEPLPVPQAAPAKVVARAPEPGPVGRLMAEEVDEKNHVIRWKLSNGDEFIWHRTQDPQLRFAARSAAGYRQSGAPAWQWQIAAQLAREADPATQPPGSLSRWASEQKLNLNQEQKDDSLSYSGQSTAAQLEDLLRLYAARQTASRIDPQALSGSLRQLARQIARQPASVSAALAREMAVLRFAAAELDASPTAEALLALEGEAGQARIEDLARQLSAAPVRYFLAGEIEPEVLRGLLGRHLAGIPRDPASVAAEPLLQRAGRHESRLAIGIEPQASVRAIGSQSMNWSPERAVGVAILSRVAYRVLRSELREAQNGIYRLNFTMTLDPASGRLGSELYFTTDPARIDELWGHAHKVLATLPARLDDALLEAEIRNMKAAEGRRREDAGSRFARLQLSYARWGDARYLADSQHLLDGMNVRTLRALAAELALTRDMASVILLPAVEGKGAGQ